MFHRIVCMIHSTFVLCPSNVFCLPTKYLNGRCFAFIQLQSGIAGALAQLHLGEAKSKEQEAYEEHMRRQCWETGNIDYMGRDSFDNIWKRIQQTINTGSCMEESSEASVAQTTAPGTTQRASRRPSRSRSATPKRDPKDRSPTPQPEEKISVDKKEGN